MPSVTKGKENFTTPNCANWFHTLTLILLYFTHSHKPTSTQLCVQEISLLCAARTRDYTFIKPPTDLQIAFEIKILYNFGVHCPHEVVHAWVHCTLPISPLCFSQGCCFLFVFLCLENVPAKNILTCIGTILFTVRQQGNNWQACYTMPCHAPLSRVQGPPQQAVMVWSLQHALTLGLEIQMQDQCKAGCQQPTCTCCWPKEWWSQPNTYRCTSGYPPESARKRRGGIQGDIKCQGSHVPQSFSLVSQVAPDKSAASVAGEYDKNTAAKWDGEKQDLKGRRGFCD